MATNKREVGAALRSALEARECALSADEARSLACSIIGFIADGLLVTNPSAETGHTYNMASLCTSQGGDRD